MYTPFFKLQRVAQDFRYRIKAFSTNEEQVRTFLRKTIRLLDRDLAILENEHPCLYSHSVEDKYLPVYSFLRNTVKIRDRGMTITFKNCPSIFLADVEEQLEPRFLFLKSCSDAVGKQNFPWHVHIQKSPNILIENQDKAEKRCSTILSDCSSE